MAKKDVEENDSELEEELDGEELEEIAEDVEEESPEIEIDDNQFREFIRPLTRTDAPVLERIAGEQESGARFFRTAGEREEENQTNYSLNRDKPNEIKYDEQPKTFNQEISTGIRPDVGLARDANSMTQNFVFNTPEFQQKDFQNSRDEYVQPKRFEQRNEGAPIEQKPEKKYREFKPR